MMKNIDAGKFAKFCKATFDFNSAYNVANYKSLPLCILDDVFSLRANYDLDIKVVDNFAKSFLNGDKYVSNYTIDQFISDIDSEPSFEEFTEKHIKYRNKIARRLKIEVCRELAEKFSWLGIQTINDFNNYKKEILEIIIKSVKGLGDAAVSYLFMLAGDTTQVKVDTHINKSVKACFGNTLTNDETIELFRNTVNILSKDYPNLTVSRLDNIIWSYYKNI